MWPEWESTSVAEEKLTMRHLWVELLSLSQLHKIHYSLRWSPNAINKKRWEKAAAVEVCRIAPALGCPISQRFAERVAGGLTHGAMPPAAPRGSWALYPKTPDSPDGRKHLAKMMAEQSSHKPAAFTWDSCRNTRHLQKLHPLRWHQCQKAEQKQRGQRRSAITKHLLQEIFEIRRAHGRKAQDMAKDLDNFLEK